jgi:hypothetical protein
VRAMVIGRVVVGMDVHQRRQQRRQLHGHR